MFWRKKHSSSSPEPGAAVLRCNFCNKSQRHVRRIVAGPGVNICNECVDICLDIIRESVDGEAQAASGPYDATSPGLFCSVCTNRKAFSEGARLPECGFVCFKCMAAVRAFSPVAPA